MDNSKVAIISTVINQELYQKSSQLFPRGIQKYVIDGINGMHSLYSILYMMKKLKGRGVEWLIMADEDVLFVNPDLIYSLIEEMKSKNYFVCGVRDGGVIPNRYFSPYLINTFFSIINFKELEIIWNEKDVLKNQYINDNEFTEDLNELKEPYDVKSIYEPYYCFYFWLRRKNKKILFLEATTPFSDDRITTLVYDRTGAEMLYHTWYARTYGTSEKHTNRINKIFELLQFKNNNIVKPIVFKDRTFYIIQKIKKLNRRLRMKLQKIGIDL
ncbi:MAG: hypothetical protein Q7J14_00610 [Candidatus Magasanikbacteria bacterium]|nr:hypothetical protein [Candidatus Magasanikbacteria bacterium]